MWHNKSTLSLVENDNEAMVTHRLTALLIPFQDRSTTTETPRIYSIGLIAHGQVWVLSSNTERRFGYVCALLGLAIIQS